MFNFNNLTDVNGFDISNPKNATQNSYAWSMTELGDYIYVGTSRNMLSSMVSMFGSAALSVPPSYITGKDNNAEIWRYKKDGSKPWQRVLKGKPCDKIQGFRAMITHKSNYSNAIYAATIGENVQLFKSTDGIHWIKLNTKKLVGTSSRALASLNGRLYIATLEQGIGGRTPYLYSSSDPEYEAFDLVIDPRENNFIPSKNPKGGIDNLSVFNNKLYVSIATNNGAEIWRSNDCNPRNNSWTLIGDKGFGDKLNKNVMSSGVFKDKLYIAVTKQFPLSLYVPMGFDLIRIDKNDNWEIVVGEEPILESYPSKGKRRKSISGLKSGFNNYFNVYGWQIQEFKDNLFITTYDASTNIKLLLDTFMYNKENLIKKVGTKDYKKFTDCFNIIYYILNKYNYPKGFDIYTSIDGCQFTPINLNGINNSYNYGGRTLHVSSENELYLGTANPYEGCEVWKINCDNTPKYCHNAEVNSYLCTLRNLNKDLICVYPVLLELFNKLLYKK